MKLKPCPFCGGEAMLEQGATELDNFIYCSKCRAGTRIFNTKNSAVKAWNRREPIEYIIEQLKVWRDTSLDSIEECAYNKAIEIVKGGAV